MNSPFAILLVTVCAAPLFGLAMGIIEWRREAIARRRLDAVRAHRALHRDRKAGR